MTAHSIDRTIERARIPRGAAKKMICKAVNNGTKAADMPAKERKYMESRAKGDCFFVFFMNYLFLMDKSGLCITMYPVPKWFGKNGNYDGKTQIRNKKRYKRYNPEIVDAYEL